MEELLLVIRGAPRVWFGDLAAICLVVYYIFVTDASLNSKAIVAVLLAVSLVVLFVKPSYWLWVLLLHVAVGIYIGFCLAWKRQ